MTERPVDDPGEDADPEAVFKKRLQQFHVEAGKPSFRDLERLFTKLGRPQSKTAIQAKLTGMTTPDWQFVETFVQACGKHAGTGRMPDLQQWRDWHAQMLTAIAVHGSLPAVAGTPYRGLEAFGEQDSLWFHGRRGAVDQVLAALDTYQSGVLLLGPSGAGKSSLLRAGVLPALGGGALPGSDRWLRVYVRPRQNLAVELETVGLLGAGVSLAEALRRRLAEQPAGCRLLLVIVSFPRFDGAVVTCLRSGRG